MSQWLVLTVLRKLVEEIDKINRKLLSMGLKDQLGERNLSVFDQHARVSAGANRRHHERGSPSRPPSTSVPQASLWAAGK